MAEFTIITPVLNGADYIEQCILSVLEQDMDVQHIIMDGGSTDGTQDMIARYADSIAYWQSRPDGGQSDAINNGLAMAQGRICNWLNADDVLCKGALREVAVLMDDATDVVTGKCRHVDSHGNEIAVGGTVLFETVEQTLGRYSMGQPSHFYRTAAWKTLGNLNPKLHLAMDMDLWFRYLLANGQAKVRTTTMVLSHFLLREDAKSQKQADQMAAEKYGLFRALLQHRPMPDALRQYMSTFPIPDDVSFQGEHIDLDKVLAHFCYPLLPWRYAAKDVPTTAALLHVVINAGLLTYHDRILWQLRLLKLRATA